MHRNMLCKTKTQESRSKIQWKLARADSDCQTFIVVLNWVYFGLVFTVQKNNIRLKVVVDLTLNFLILKEK